MTVKQNMRPQQMLWMMGPAMSLAHMCSQCPEIAMQHKLAIKRTRPTTLHKTAEEHTTQTA